MRLLLLLFLTNLKNKTDSFPEEIIDIFINLSKLKHLTKKLEKNPFRFLCDNIFLSEN